MIEANLQVTSGAAAPLFLAFISGDTGVWKTGLRSSSWGGGVGQRFHLPGILPTCCNSAVG